MPEESKRQAILQVLCSNPEMPCSQVARCVGCSTRYVQVTKKILNQTAKQDWKPRSNEVELTKSSSNIEITQDTKALLVADIHAPFHVPRALDAFLNFGVNYAPDILVVAGDLADIYGGSYFTKDPSVMRLSDEFEKTNRVLDVIDSAFPGIIKVLIEGNHEERLRNYLLREAPGLLGLKGMDIQSQLNLNERGWRYVSNITRMRQMKSPFRIGDLHILHGHEIDVRSKDPINLPRLFYQKANIQMAVAHHHRSDEYWRKRADHTYIKAFSLGCLCDLSVDYQPATNWNHGFATVEFVAGGDYWYQTRRIYGDRVK